MLDYHSSREDMMHIKMDRQHRTLTVLKYRYWREDTIERKNRWYRSGGQAALRNTKVGVLSKLRTAVCFQATLKDSTGAPYDCDSPPSKSQLDRKSFQSATAVHCRTESSISKIRCSNRKHAIVSYLIKEGASTVTECFSRMRDGHSRALYRSWTELK